MAKIPKTGTSFFNLPLGIKRLNAIPLDPSSYFKSLELAKDYAKNSPIAFVGQHLVVASEYETQTPRTFVISNTAGDLIEIGSGTVVTVGTLPDDVSPPGTIIFVEDQNSLFYSAKNEDPNSEKEFDWKILFSMDMLKELSKGTGDMLQSVYDKNGNGIVDVAEKVKHSLIFDDKKGSVTKFDGSEEIVITPELIGALTALPIATKDNAGVIIIGDTLEVSENGIVNIPIASRDTLGLVKLSTDFRNDETGRLYISDSLRDTIDSKFDERKGKEFLESQKGKANGIAPLNSYGLIDPKYIPGTYDDIIEGTYVNPTTFLVDGVNIEIEPGKIYIHLVKDSAGVIVDTVQYRWSGSQLVAIHSGMDIASEEDAKELTNDTKMMTPAKTKVAIENSKINFSQLTISDFDSIFFSCGDSSF